MVCSHCGQPGHTYRRCPTITEEEKKEKMKKIKEEKQAVEERRRIREERKEEEKRKSLANKKTNYDIANTTNYEVALYWGNIDENTLHHFTYCNSRVI